MNNLNPSTKQVTEPIVTKNQESDRTKTNNTDRTKEILDDQYYVDLPRLDAKEAFLIAQERGCKTKSSDNFRSGSFREKTKKTYFEKYGILRLQGKENGVTFVDVWAVYPKKEASKPI